MVKMNSEWGWVWGCRTVQGSRVICRRGRGRGGRRVKGKKNKVRREGGVRPVLRGRLGINPGGHQPAAGPACAHAAVAVTLSCASRFGTFPPSHVQGAHAGEAQAVDLVGGGQAQGGALQLKRGDEGGVGQVADEGGGACGEGGRDGGCKVARGGEGRRGAGRGFNRSWPLEAQMDLCKPP